MALIFPKRSELFLGHSKSIANNKKKFATLSSRENNFLSARSGARALNIRLNQFQMLLILMPTFCVSSTS